MGTEPEFPYSKKPIEPEDKDIKAPPPMPPPEPPPSSPPFGNRSPTRFKCSQCGKEFTTREELTMHMETVHMSPKKKV